MDFLEILQTLAERGVELVIVGGVAARLYGSTRLTHDLDIVPRLEPDTWRELVGLLWDLGGRPRIPETREAVSDLGNVESGEVRSGWRHRRRVQLAGELRKLRTRRVRTNPAGTARSARAG